MLKDGTARFDLGGVPPEARRRSPAEELLGSGLAASCLALDERRRELETRSQERKHVVPVVEAVRVAAEAEASGLFRRIEPNVLAFVDRHPRVRGVHEIPE